MNDKACSGKSALKHNKAAILETSILLGLLLGIVCVILEVVRLREEA